MIALIASAAVALGLTAVAVVAMIVAAKRARMAITIVVALLFVVAPFGVEHLTATLLHERRFLWFDLPLLPLAIPGAAAAFAAWAIQRRRPFPGSANSVAIWTWCAIWGAANTWNACNPGWCGRYGFPFPFYSWSDAFITFDGVRPQPFHPMLLVLDIVVLVAGAYSFGRRVDRAADKTSRDHPQPAA
jgi:hypothetical protein